MSPRNRLGARFIPRGIRLLKNEVGETKMMTERKLRRFSTEPEWEIELVADGGPEADE